MKAEDKEPFVGLVNFTLSKHCHPSSIENVKLVVGLSSLAMLLRQLKIRRPKRTFFV
jgi:hypothetical protein